MPGINRESYIRALAELDGPQRRVFSRRFELGLSYEEISAELDEDSVDSLRAIVKDALAGLAAGMTGHEPSLERLDDVLESLSGDSQTDWAALASGATPDDQALLSALRAIEAFNADNLAFRTSDAAAADGVAGVSWPGLEIRSRLGAGSFGQVYRAWDPDLERSVALKLSHATAADPREYRRLKQEARHLAQLRHPNIVAVHGVEEHDGRLGIQMELIEGETLAAVVGDERTLSADEAAAIGIKLCHALAAATAKGLIHSDIKAQKRDEGIWWAHRADGLQGRAVQDDG